MYLPWNRPFDLAHLSCQTNILETIRPAKNNDGSLSFLRWISYFLSPLCCQMDPTLSYAFPLFAQITLFFVEKERNISSEGFLDLIQSGNFNNTPRVGWCRMNTYYCSINPQSNRSNVFFGYLGQNFLYKTPHFMSTLSGNQNTVSLPFRWQRWLGTNSGLEYF